jgi:hypothetical protein
MREFEESWDAGDPDAGPRWSEDDYDQFLDSELYALPDPNSEEHQAMVKLQEQALRASTARVRRTDGKARKTHDPEKKLRRRPTVREYLEHCRNAHLWTPETRDQVCWCPRCMLYKARRDGIPGKSFLASPRFWMSHVI